MQNVAMISEVTEPRASFPIEQEIAPRAPMLWLLVCGLALMVAIAVATVLSIDKFRENAIENGKDGLESAVLLLVRHGVVTRAISPLLLETFSPPPVSARMRP